MFSFRRSPSPRGRARTPQDSPGSERPSPSSSPMPLSAEDPRPRKTSSSTLPFSPSSAFGSPPSRVPPAPDSWAESPLATSPPIGSIMVEAKGPKTNSRSVSHAPVEVLSSTPPNAPPATWWGRAEIGVRPWSEKTSEKSRVEKNVVPKDQTEGWQQTREHVARAAISVLGTAADVGHEALIIGADMLQFAPIAGLSEAARVLLGIWDALQKVDLNRMACLRLTERCADILMSVREEIHEAGDKVAEELKDSIAKLVTALKGVHVFLQRQINLPFIKRYLKRDTILNDIQACDAGLQNALELFSLSIQIRILKHVQRSEERRKSSLAYSFQSSEGGSTPLPSDFRKLPPESIRSKLRTLHMRQNVYDAENDVKDLRSLMRTAIQSSSDAELIEVLQVGREEMPEAIKTLQRALERRGLATRQRIGSVATVDGHDSADDSESSEDRALSIGSARDILDKEFIESGIDALRRISLSSRGKIEQLPSWTITRYEVDREEKIGIGFFSDVYRGTWRARVVAIKVLAESTPRSLFLREVNIWKKLQHPNVLELYGASATDGDGPWFFVCKFCKGGSLVAYLKGLDEDTWNASIGNGGLAGERRPKVDLLKMMLEVAKGMDYLHSQGVLHGDLKASNVLVDLPGGKPRCIVSDFGQSEMKNEVYRLSGTAPPHGTLRWQAPELMGGHNHSLTAEIDIYAYAISCTEIVTKGGLPWPRVDDSTVRHLVLRENLRPQVPRSRIATLVFVELLNLCWHKDPIQRPLFSRIVVEIKRIRTLAGLGNEESPRPPAQEIQDSDTLPPTPSPDMRPIALPGDSSIVEDCVESGIPASPSSSESYTTAESEPFEEASATVTNAENFGPTDQSHILPQSRTEDRGLGAGSGQSLIPIVYTPPIGSASVLTLDPEDCSDDAETGLDYYLDTEYDPPAPTDNRVANLMNERRYRLLLSHDFHASLTLPLWKPSPVALGAVGYIMKPEGDFVTLFNMFDPPRSSKGVLQGFPSVYGYGKVTRGCLKQDRRNAALRGLGALSDLLTFKPKNDTSVSKHISRRYGFTLRAGHPAAHLCTESTVYRYVEDLEAPKNWFKAHVDAILHAYGVQHRIQKEDLFLVIGTLEASDYALYVSHQHPDGKLFFNVFSSPKSEQEWGSFTIEAGSQRAEGPHYDEVSPDKLRMACKVSKVGRSDTWDTVLVARLRFKPDAVDPTRL